MAIEQLSATSEPAESVEEAVPPWWTATWVAGPAAGGTARVDPGTAIVGRSELAAVRCADPLLEPFHLQLEIGSGRARLVQVGGRLPVTIDGGLPDGAADLDSGRTHTIDAGASRLLLRPPTARRARPPVQLGAAGGGRRSLVRSGRIVPVWEPPAIEVPAPEQQRSAFSGSLIPALLGLGGAALIAVVLRQPMFLLFGAIGAAVAIATWVGQRIGLIRHRRRSQRTDREAMAAFSDGVAAQRVAWTRYHRRTVPTLASAVTTAGDPDATLWSRRTDHPDAFTVSLGVGEVTWQPVVDARGRTVPAACWGILERAATVADLPVPASLGAGTRTALCGPHATAVAEAVIAQLAVQAGPADWRLSIVTETPDRWQHWASLPHAHDAASVSGIMDEQSVADLLRELRPALAPDERGGRCHWVIVVDDVRLLAARTSPVRRLLAAEPDAALVAIVADASAVPAVCTSLLTTSLDGRASWIANTTTGELPRPLRLAGLARADAATVADALAAFSDPEDVSSGSDVLPDDVRLVTLVGDPDAAAIAATWAEGGADVAPLAPVGLAADGVVAIDLVRDGPHALLAGTTGAGKSELLRSLVVGLAARLSPEQVNFVLIDYKGGAAFDGCTPLPHVVGLVTDLDGRMTERALRSLRAELTRREHVLRQHGAIDLTSLRAATGVAMMARLVVVVDEFAAMAIEHGDLLHALIGIAQRGRSLGVHLVLATQRPSGVINDDIRANTNLRIALRLTDTSDSVDVIGDPAAAGLGRNRPGRAFMRLGPDELIAFQSAHDADPLVALVGEAARLTGTCPPRRPWCEPLPAELASDSVGDDTIGLLDVPDLQEQRPWRWAPADGHVVVAGAHGSGVTTTLLRAAMANLDESTELIVVDGRGDPRWDELDGHPRSAGVVRLGERERLIRAITTLGTAAPVGVRRMLVVDGIAPLRLELEAIELMETRAVFERVLADGSLGLTLLIGTDAPAAVPPAILSCCPNRWVHHLPSAHDGPTLGVGATHVPPTLVPGRAAVVQGREVYEAQVALADPRRIGARPSFRPAPRIGTLPAHVDASCCGHATTLDGMLVLPVGLRFDDLQAAVLPVADGDHVLVVGPGRSGRSTVLARLLNGWTAVHPQGWVGVVAPRRSPLSHGAHTTLEGVVTEIPAAGPALVVVDDAELVDDPSGALAGLIGSRRTGVLVVAAGRPDSLRASYGHWSTGIRRSRLGIVMSGATDMDADLLGATLPRWAPLPPRPGLAHVVADGCTTFVQCAIDATGAAGPRRTRPPRLAAVS